MMSDDLSFIIGIKSLDTEELLDFWVEMQRLDASIHAEYPHVSCSVDHEALIVRELQLRSLTPKAQQA